MADSSVKSSVNSAMLQSMSSHSNQGPIVSGDAGQEYNAFVDIGGDVGRDIINKSGLDNVVAVFSTDSTDLKIVFDSAGQVWGFNMNSGGVPIKITTLAPNDRVTQELALSSYSIWKEQNGQQHQ